jgi:hypothetical protein
LQGRGTYLTKHHVMHVITLNSLHGCQHVVACRAPAQVCSRYWKSTKKNGDDQNLDTSNAFQLSSRNRSEAVTPEGHKCQLRLFV